MFTEKWIDKEIQKERIAKEEKYELLSRFSYSKDLRELNQSDVIIEAVTE